MPTVIRHVVAFLAMPAVSLAQQPDSLPRVVITATRVEAPIGSGIATATVIDRATLQRTAARDLAEVLRSVPGVAIARSGGPGAQSSLFIRGGENDYVRVLVDGVPVNDPGGAIDLSWLSVDDVERIEVVRGPASVLYGTDAVTGVIQVFTRRPSRHSADAEVAAGRYGTTLVHGSASSGEQRLSFAADASRERSEGVLEFNNGYSRDVLSARARSGPSATSRLELSVRQVRDIFHFPTDGAGNVEDRNSYRDNSRRSAALAASREWSWIRGEISLLSIDLSGRDDDRPDSPADTSGFHSYDARTLVRRRIADARVHLSLPGRSILTLGAERVKEDQRGNDSSNYSFERARFEADRRNAAAYGQLLADAGRLSVSAGVRWDENNTYGAFRTGRGGLSFRTWQGGSLRASIGSAFKAPTFFESFNTAFSTGNADLAPERSASWEAGIRQASLDGRLALSATWFDQRFRDMIQYAFLSPDQPNYFNVAAASARGLELEASAPLPAGARAVASATFLRTRVDDAGLQSGPGATFVAGQRLLRRPGAVVTASVIAALPGGATADIAVRYTGQRDDRDFGTFPATPVTLPSYTRVDATFVGPVAADWIGATLDLVLRLDNVFGAGYQEIANFPAPGRSLTIGLRAASLRR